MSEALGLDWHHVSNRHGKSAFAKAVDVDPKTVNRAITGETMPELHTALASLLIDPTALQRTFALYGFKAVPISGQAANDMETVASLSELVTQFVKVLEDGVRDHNETLSLSTLIAPLLARLHAIMEESRRIEGVAA